MQTKRLPTTRRQRVLIVAIVILALIGLGAVYTWLVSHGHGIPCLFYKITGLRCPGCGISRALTALLHLRLDMFIEYNLLAPLMVLYVLMLIVFTAKNYIQKGRVAYTSPGKWIDIAMLVTLLLWWAVRNIVAL